MTRLPRLVLVAAAVTAAFAPAAHAQQSFPQFCTYPTDYGICTPTPKDVVDQVPQWCTYPTDFPLCIPPNV
ncbi:MAG TPA: hypothetical protein VFQ85_10465 [Mycobacteriales bacterium]|jgi:hypothetical protein|nr:hypothetical protein [Mycobacteriales bacterium]